MTRTRLVAVVAIVLGLAGSGWPALSARQAPASKQAPGIRQAPGIIYLSAALLAGGAS